jgi:hypothetical protein
MIGPADSRGWNFGIGGELLLKSGTILGILLLGSGLMKAQVAIGSSSDLLGANRLMGGPVGGAVTAPPPDASGFGIYSVSATTTVINEPSYISTSLTGNYRLQNQMNTYMGGTASFGYVKTLGERSRFYILYAPGFSVLPQDLSQSTMSHRLNMNFSDELSSRWDFHFALNASYAELQEYAFEAAQIGQVAQVPGSMEDFLNGVLNGQYNNTQIASLLTGAPILEAPARSSIYGNETLTISASTSLGYKISPRLSMTFLGTSTRNQIVGTAGDSFLQPLAPVTTTGSGGVTLSYELTPQSSIAFSARVQRTLSQVSDGNYYSGTGTYTRRIGQRWGLGLTGGGGSTRFSDLNVANYRPSANYIASGNLIFQATPHQAISVTAGRTFIDDYGLGLTSTQTAGIHWTCSLPELKWSAMVGVTYNKSSQNASQSVQGYGAYLGINRMVAAHQGVGFQAFYFHSSNDLSELAAIPTAVIYNEAGVRAVYTWFPKPIDYVTH